MKVVVALALIVLATSFTQTFEQCIASFTKVKTNFLETLQKQNVNEIIDGMEVLSQEISSVLESCGSKRMAEQAREQFPPSCTKLLAQQVKLLVKIMRLYSEDKDKNEKLILLYLAKFQATYKNQVQKQCLFLGDQPLQLNSKNKGECAEGIYQLSLTFQQLDIDLMAGKFNVSLTDAGKIIQKLPDTLDNCNQQALAKMIRYNFPDECLSALGAFARELATIEHNYSHLEWLMNHFKDFTSALIRVKDTCPALSR